MQPIKIFPDGSGYPPVGRSVLGRWYTPIEDGESPWYYMITTWDGEHFWDTGKEYEMKDPHSWVYLEQAFETY